MLNLSIHFYIIYFDGIPANFYYNFSLCLAWFCGFIFSFRLIVEKPMFK